MNIDAIDKKIIRELQINARISNAELAERVNLSATPCARRVKNLEQAGIIQSHTSIINAEKLGLNLMVMISITMKKHTEDQFEQFEKEVATLPEVMDCYVVTGQDSDFLIRVLVRDMRHYEQFLLKQLTSIQGVSAVHSSFVLRQSIHRHDIPL